MLLLVVVGAAHFRVGKVGAQVLAQAYLVDEVELIRLVDFQIHPTVLRVAFCLGRPTLLDQRIAQALHCRHGGLVDKAFHRRAVRKVDDTGQTFLPVGRQAVVAVATDLHLVLQTDVTVPFDHQCPPHAEHGNDHDDGKGQGGDDGHGLQGAQTAGNQQHGCHNALQNGPERALPDRRLHHTAGGQRVDHQRARVRGGHEEGNDQHHRDEGHD